MIEYWVYKVFRVTEIRDNCVFSTELVKEIKIQSPWRLYGPGESEEWEAKTAKEHGGDSLGIRADRMGTKMMPTIIERLAPVKYYVDDDGIQLDLRNLIDTLYDLEGVDGFTSRLFIEDRWVAAYLQKEQVIIKRHSGGYRLLEEKNRQALLEKVENTIKTGERKSKNAEV